MPHDRAPNAGFENLINFGIDAEMAEVSAFQLFFNFARNLLVLSLIFLLYQDYGYAAWEIASIFCMWSIGNFLMTPLAKYVIPKIGIKHSIALRGLGEPLFWLSFPFFLDQGLWSSYFPLLFLVILIRSFGTVTSIVAYDVFLTHHANKKSKGGSLARMEIYIIIAAILAPLLGAYIKNVYGFHILTIVSLCFFLFSSLVLFLTPDEKVQVSYSLKELASDSFTRSPRSLVLSEMGRVFLDCVSWFLWPTFLVLVIEDLGSAAMIISASSFVSMMVSFLIGKKIDKGEEASNKILKKGVYRSVLINVFRAVWIEPVFISLLDGLNKINNQTIRVPYNMCFYEWMHEENTLERSHVRRWIADFFYVIISLFFVFVLMFFEPSLSHDFGIKSIFIPLFGIGALSIFFIARILLVPKAKEKKNEEVVSVG